MTTITTTTTTTETECACRFCMESELYSRLYCHDCFDMACGKTDDDNH